MQAITVKYLGPTNNRGARYKAYSMAGFSVTTKSDNERSVYDNYNAAALALAVKMGWTGLWVRGTAADNNEVYVRVSPMSDTAKEMAVMMGAKSEYMGEYFVVTDDMVK